MLNDYIEDLSNKVESCHSDADLGGYVVDKEKEASLILKNKQICQSTYLKLTLQEANEIVVTSRNAIFKTNNDFQREIQIGAYETRQTADVLIAILSVGALVYALSSPSYTSSNTSFTPDSGCGGFIQCGFSWNPMNLDQIPM